MKWVCCVYSDGSIASFPTKEEAIAQIEEDEHVIEVITVEKLDD